MSNIGINYEKGSEETSNESEYTLLYTVGEILTEELDCPTEPQKWATSFGWTFTIDSSFPTIHSDENESGYDPDYGRKRVWAKLFGAVPCPIPREGAADEYAGILNHVLPSGKKGEEILDCALRDVKGK
jgi:hypothetical protein